MAFFAFRALAAVAVTAVVLSPSTAEARLLYETSAATAAAASAATSAHLTVEDFVRLHGRNYVPGSEEFYQRRVIFEDAVRQVEVQNSRAGSLWTAAVNKFADHTAEELAALRGYSRHARPEAMGGAAAAGGGLQFLGKASRAVDLGALPQDFTWRSKLQAMSQVLNQKSCGSCWAHSSSTVLRAHSELYQEDRFCSVEQILSCTPNPQHCGGDGGCKGATAELGMGYVVRKGCVSNSDWSYKSATESKRCLQVEASFAQTVAGSGSPSTARASGSFLGGASDSALGLSMGLKGYTKLPENQLAPLMVALVERGPVAVSVYATAHWSLYHSGIMDGCPRDAIINHAVTLVGFGVGRDGAEQGQHYWQIQNSWGPDWGEGGFVRLARKSNEEEAAYCGTDRKPEQGSGCTGGPPEVRVCGACGILFDTVVPDFELSGSGLWSNRSFLEQHDIKQPRSLQGASS